MLATLVLVWQSVVTPLVYATDFVNENEDSVSETVVETVVDDPVSDESDDIEVATDIDDSTDVAEESAELEETADAEEAIEADNSETSEEPEITGEDETSEVTETEKVEQPEVKATEVESTNAVEQSVSYPAAEFKGHDWLIQVNASAGEWVFPEGTTMKVSQITASEAEDIAKEELWDAVKSAIWVDISFRDIEWNEIEPRNAQDVHVSVSLINRPFVRDMEDANLTIVHQDNDGNTQSIQNVDVEKGYTEATAEFDHNHFSIFVIALVNFKLINFINSGTVITWIYLKDASETSSLIFDPGVELEDWQVFHGWTTGENYTTESTPMSIADVQSYISGNFETLWSEIDIYAMVFNRYIVRYHDEWWIVFDTEEVPYKDCWEEICEVEYIINHDYETNNEEFNLLWWKINNEGDSIKNWTPYTLTWDLDLWADVEQWHWLVFDENGKWGTYNAPQFVEINDVTQKPSLEMKRFGYSFAWWYKDSDCTEWNEFSFGSELTEKTTIYAKWTPNEKAGYTVIFWTQNANRDGYDVKASLNVPNWRVGQNIPYTFKDNWDEDYVVVNGNDYHYKGFSLKEDIENVKITPEGDAVLNLYYDRVEYNLKFYLYRQDGKWKNSYQYAQNSNGGQNIWGVANWYNATNVDNMPTTTYPGGIKSKDNVDGYTAYYIELTGYYGENISEKWPTYSQILGPSEDRQPVSYIMMNGTKLKPNPSNWWDSTVKGVINIMDENILGSTNDKDWNFFIVRFNTYNNWTYHIYYEKTEWEVCDITREVRGKEYCFDHDVESRSSNTIPGSQNPPQYQWFKSIMDGSRPYYDGVAPTTEIPQQNGVSWYSPYLNYYYDREVYSISYFDGAYVDGNNNKRANHSTYLFKESEEIWYGLEISNSDKEYVPSAPNEDGYVFEWWYIDEDCTEPYTFTTMPVGWIKVYAKWRQIQYRVFLHPNVPASDTSLDWGSESQDMNFRVSHGGKVSTPTWTRSGYVFVGWYQDEALIKMFNGNVFVLNESTVKTPYDKTSDFTDPMDKWWNGATENHDADRFRITKKLDLYAKWSKILLWASGVNLVYVDENGNLLWSDDTILYADQSVASALQAPAVPAGKVFESWVVQEWNEGKYVDTEEEVYPGLPFTIDVSKAKFEKNDQCESEEENCNKYVMQIRAKYVDEWKPETTTIQYFDGSELKPDLTQTINVNEEFTFAEALIKAWNEFLGWTDWTNTYTWWATGYAADNKGVEEGKVNMLYAKWKCEGDEHLDEQWQCVDKVEKACTWDIAEWQIATNATWYVRWDDSINDWAEAPACQLACDEENGYHDDNWSCVREVERECTPNKEIPEWWKEVSSTGTVAWSGTDWAEAPVCELVCDEEKWYHDEQWQCVPNEKEVKTPEVCGELARDSYAYYLTWTQTLTYTVDENGEWSWSEPNCEAVCEVNYHPVEENTNEENPDNGQIINYDGVVNGTVGANNFPTGNDNATAGNNETDNTEIDNTETPKVNNFRCEINTYTVTFDSKGWSAVTWQTVEYGKTATQPTNPNRNGYNFKEWTLSWEKFDFSTPITWDITLEAQWDKINNPWWGGWGSSHYSCKWEVPANAVANNDKEPSNSSTSYSYSTDKDGACTFQCKSGYTRKDGKCEESGWNNWWDDDEEIELGWQVSDKCSVEWTNRSEEEIAAYLYACENDITTIRDINKARLGDFLTRAEMAKMVSVFATKELWMKPNTSKDCSNFANSIASYNQEMKDYMVMSCQLELMWIHTVNYEPIPDFMPSKRVSRAEFGTVLSRVLRWNKYEWTNSNYYVNHLNALKENNIITNINPHITEYRAWVFLMLYRSVEAIKVLKAASNESIEQQVNEELQEEWKAETGLVVEYDSWSVVPDMTVVTESGTLATWSVAEVGTGSVVEAQSGNTVLLTGDDISKEVSAETWSTAETETWSTSD